MLMLRPPGGSGDENGTRYERAQKTYHYPDLGSTSDWSCPAGNLLQLIINITQIWLVTHHRYGISEHCKF